MLAPACPGLLQALAPRPTRAPLKLVQQRAQPLAVPRLERADARALQAEQRVDRGEVRARGGLALLLGLVEVAVERLECDVCDACEGGVYFVMTGVGVTAAQFAQWPAPSRMFCCGRSNEHL